MKPIPKSNHKSSFTLSNSTLGLTSNVLSKSSALLRVAAAPPFISRYEGCWSSSTPPPFLRFTTDSPKATVHRTPHFSFPNPAYMFSMTAGSNARQLGQTSLLRPLPRATGVTEGLSTEISNQALLTPSRRIRASASVRSAMWDTASPKRARSGSRCVPRSSVHPASARIARMPLMWLPVRVDGSSRELADSFDGVRERGIGSAKRR